MKKTRIVAIDGHSSCGKSTLAKDIAAKLSYTYIDSGAMYRAVCLYAIRKNVFENNIPDEKKLRKVISEVDIKFINEKGKFITYLNNEDVSEEIREQNVSQYVSQISKIPFVRDKLVKLQRKIGLRKDVVMDGRDIGSVVFPDADVKIFLTAEAKIRAERRYKELKEKGYKVDFKRIFENILKRDNIDSNREMSPLKKTDDAIMLDNSELNRKQQLEKAVEIVKSKINEN